MNVASISALRAPARLTAALPAPPPERPSSPPTPKAAAGVGGPSLREQVAIAEKLTGKPSHFKTEPELAAYLNSLETALPQSAYDPNGFLAGLGLTGLRASGRTDEPVLDAVRAQPGYVPNDDNDGKPVWIQGKFFDLAMKHPDAFDTVKDALNPALEAKGKFEAKWKKPLESVQKAVPSNVTPQVRYKDALAHLQQQRLTFGPDVHGGLPDVNNPTFPTYGTYTIALNMGFDVAAATRFGTMCEGIDDGTTPYGKSTGPMPTQQTDRHFNLDRTSEDTRLVYANDHLQAAIKFAKVGSYDQAEIELGCGLHSLQDLFAHGQITPSVHAVIGQFPDDVDWNPVAYYEAAGATVAYFQAYLKAIAPARVSPLQADAAF